MVYRGFRIDCVSSEVLANPALADPIVPADAYTEYRVLESLPGFQWQEIGVANDLSIAREMVDRLILARERFAKVVGFAM